MARFTDQSFSDFPLLAGRALGLVPANPTSLLLTIDNLTNHFLTSRLSECEEIVGKKIDGGDVKIVKVGKDGKRKIGDEGKEGEVEAVVGSVVVHVLNG